MKEWVGVVGQIDPPSAPQKTTPRNPSLTRFRRDKTIFDNF